MPPASSGDVRKEKIRRRDGAFPVLSSGRRTLPPPVRRGPFRKGGAVKPQVRAILLADQVYRDEETGKCVIAGTFNRIGADRFPATHPTAVLYLNLSDFEGRAELRIRLADDRDGSTLHEHAFEVGSSNRLGSCEVTVRLNNLTFPAPGKYSLEITMGEEYLGHLPLELVLHRPG
jgi:hypothetical protein